MRPGLGGIAGHPGFNAGAHPGFNAGAHPGFNAAAHPGFNAAAHPGFDAAAHPGFNGAAHPGFSGAGSARAGFAGRPGHFRGYRGRDVRRLPAARLAEWRGGTWWQGTRDGVTGWWWVVDGDYFLYPQPIDPYPLVVSQYMAEAAPAELAPPGAGGPPPAPAAAGYAPVDLSPPPSIAVSQPVPVATTPPPAQPMPTPQPMPVAMPTPAPAGAPPAASGGAWYFCEGYGYYPNVTSCPTPWRPVASR